MRAVVIQPLPGIGDMIWHLPHIRALAAHVGAPVTVLTKPRSAADQLLRGEAAVSEVMWLDRNPASGAGKHDGMGLLRAAHAVRVRGFDALYLFHHSKSLAVMARLAGIPARFGYGFGVQRLFLNRGPFLPAQALRLHPLDQATAWLTMAGIPMQDTEPTLAIHPDARRSAKQMRGTSNRHFVAVGIGSSEPRKQWGAERFSALVSALLQAGWPEVVLLGGPAEAALAEEIVSRASAGPGQITVVEGAPLGDVAVLLADAAFYVGNDTGVMNIAAAVGTLCFGLFGATPPLTHSTRIIPVVPAAGGPSGNGMAAITIELVLRTIRSHRSGLGPSAP